jgi:hypothetical protein
VAQPPPRAPNCALASPTRAHDLERKTCPFSLFLFSHSLPASFLARITGGLQLPPFVVSVVSSLPLPLLLPSRCCPAWPRHTALVRTASARPCSLGALHARCLLLRARRNALIFVGSCIVRAQRAHRFCVSCALPRNNLLIHLESCMLIKVTSETKVNRAPN